MLIRRVLAALVFTLVGTMTVPAHAQTPAEAAAALAYCKQYPHTFACGWTTPDPSQTPGVDPKPGVQESGSSHITCNPPHDDNGVIPKDVDCNGCQWNETTLAAALASFYKDLVPVNAASDIAGGSTIYQTACYQHKYANKDLEWIATPNIVVLPPGMDPPTPGVPPVDLAWKASDGFDADTAQVNLAPKTESYVNLQTFLWLTNVQRHYVTTATDGIKTVTLTADQYKVDWDMTEGVVTCADLGTPWDPTGDDNQTTACGYTYKTTSAGKPDQKYPVRATVYYKLSWTCAGAGCNPVSGTLRDKWTNKDTALKVAERQTVVTDSGGGTS